MNRLQKGMEKNRAKKAAQDRFGLIDATKAAGRAKQVDVGKMTMSTQGQTSKFKSSFGDVPPLKKSNYKGPAQRRKVCTSFFEA